MNGTMRNRLASCFLIITTVFSLRFAANYVPPKIDIYEEIEIAEEIPIPKVEMVKTEMNDDVLKDILVHFLLNGDAPIIRTSTGHEPYEFDVIYSGQKNMTEMANYISSKIDKNYIIVLLDEKNPELVRAIYGRDGKRR